MSNHFVEIMNSKDFANMIDIFEKKRIDKNHFVLNLLLLFFTTQNF